MIEALAIGEVPLKERLADALIRWGFLLFVASIPFEVMDPFGIAESFSVAKFFALGFLVVALLRPDWTFGRPHVSFWCFLAYLVMFVLLALPHWPQYGSDILDRLLTQVQLLLLFWVAGNVLRDDLTQARSLTAIGLSCTVVVILRMSGFASGGLQYGELFRVSAFNQNPNGYALTLAFGVICLLGRTRLSRFPLMAPVRWLYRGCSAFLVFEILATGARGGALALLAGLLVLFGSGGSLWLRAAKGTLIVAALGMIYMGPLGPETSRSRWEETFTAGDVAERNIIYPAAIGMGIERPLLGWGPVAHLHELGRRIQYSEGYRDTHSDVFWLWNEVGLIGAAPFLAGLCLWLRGAWRGKAGPFGPIPLANLIFILVMSLSGTLHTIKLFWLAGAYASAARTEGADDVTP